MHVGSHSDFETNGLLEPNQHLPPKRLASLDFQRGLAIWIMTLMHTFEHLYDYTWVKEDPEKILDLPLPVLIIGLIVGFFLSWHSYFLFISAVVNTLSMTKRTIVHDDSSKILAKQAITGVGILTAGFLSDGFGYNGYFGLALRTGDWTNYQPIYQYFFTMHTLRIIGWCLIINSLVTYFLIRKKGYLKYIRNMIVYGVLAIVIIILSPFIHNFVDGLHWLIPENPPPGISDNTKWPSVYFQTHNASVKAWICSLLAGDMEPLFPYLATSFAGSMIGLTLAKPKPVKRLPLIGGLSGLGIMGIGVIFFAFGFYNLSNGRPSIGNFLAILGSQIAVMMLLLWLIEYRGKGEKFANNPIIKHFRLWGMASLTIYCFQILEILPRWLLTLILKLTPNPVNLLDSGIFGYAKEYLAILVAIFCIAFFEAGVFLWSQVNFRFSFEWLIVKLSTLGSKQTSNRLNVNLILNEVDWISYKPKAEAKSLPTEKSIQS